MPTLPGGALADHFGDLADPRGGRATRHHLTDVVTLARCAMIGGAGTWVEVEAFGKAKVAWRRTFLALPHGIPAHDPLRLS